MWLNVLLTLPTTYSWQMHYHKNAEISIILVFYEILNYGKVLRQQKNKTSDSG